jgi:UPF0042 nucleotide-binding protein
MRLVMVSGHSGSGKSVALHIMEDMGYYCVDNLPTKLLTPLIELLVVQGSPIAVSLDVRNLPATLAALERTLEGLPREIRPCFLFLEADPATLIQRYSESRRRHPLAHRHDTLECALAEERLLLVPLRAKADLVIDTSPLSVHQLAEILRNRLVDRVDIALTVVFESFGFKYGIPRGADWLFDVRFLPNPHWVRTLRPLDGSDQLIARFFKSHPEVGHFINQTARYLGEWLPLIERHDRHYLTVAIGCTGGRHRSVYVVNQLADHFQRAGKRVQVHHTVLEQKASID